MCTYIRIHVSKSCICNYDVSTHMAIFIDKVIYLSEGTSKSMLLKDLKKNEFKKCFRIRKIKRIKREVLA